jgi:hypothetical protein
MACGIGMALFFFCFLLSAFFSKARTAGTFGALVYLVTYFVVFGISDTMSATGLRGLSIFFPVAMYLGTRTILNLEPVGGVTSSNLTQSYLNYSTSDCLLMLFIDCLVYFILEWYLNQVRIYVCV